MLKGNLIHILRAAHNVWTDQNYPADAPICLVGSQSILLYYDHDKLPADVTVSVEADVFLKDFPTLDAADLISGTIGQDTHFHETHEYYADGIVPDEIILPDGWLDRAKRFEIDLLDKDHTIATVFAIQPEDLIASKMVALRQKDIDYVRACKETGIIDRATLARSIDALPVDEDRKKRANSLYDGFGTASKA